MTSVLYAPNSITLGSLTFGGNVDANGVLWFPEQLQGWGSPKGTLTVTQKPRAHGGYRSESFLTPRTITVAGTIQAPTSALLAQARHALNAACSLNDTTFSVTEYGETLSATVTRQDEVLYGDETETWTTFSIQLVAEDPLRYGTPITATTNMASTSGGLTLPVTLPLTIGATVIAGTVGIFNPGDIASNFKMRIDGPGPGPVITVVNAAGEFILSSTYTLGSGNWLDIDTSAQSMRENGQASRSGYLETAQWPMFVPGNNSFSLSGHSYSASTLLTVYASPAYQ